MNTSRERLKALLEQAGQAPLEPSQLESFGRYLELLLRWNARMNLTAVRDEEGILRRHFVECIACARALPGEIGSLLDFGSGAGLPGIPIAICRPEIHVTLAESQSKKAAFLQEAVRTLGLAAEVHAGRAESLGRQFGCVTLRAVDKMERAVRGAVERVGGGGWVALLTTGAERRRVEMAAQGFAWKEPVALPGGEQRVLLLGERTAAVFHVEQS